MCSGSRTHTVGWRLYTIRFAHSESVIVRACHSFDVRWAPKYPRALLNSWKSSPSLSSGRNRKTWWRLLHVTSAASWLWDRRLGKEARRQEWRRISPPLSSGRGWTWGMKVQLSWLHPLTSPLTAHLAPLILLLLDYSDEEYIPSSSYRDNMAYRRKSVFAEAYDPASDEDEESMKVCNKWHITLQWITIEILHEDMLWFSGCMMIDSCVYICVNMGLTFALCTGLGLV